QDRPHRDYACIVHQDVNPAEFTASTRNCRLNFLLVGDVAGECPYLAAVAADLITRSGEFLLIACAQNQFAAASRELFRHCQSQPARAAGDEHRLAAQVFAAEAEWLPTLRSPLPDLRKEKPSGKCRAQPHRCSRCHGSGSQSAQNYFVSGLHKYTSICFLARQAQLRVGTHWRHTDLKFFSQTNEGFRPAARNLILTAGNGRELGL